MGEYKPPFTITNEILSYVSSISEKIGRITAIRSLETKPHLRKNNRIKLTSSLFIKRLDRDTQEKVEIEIEILDVSKSGVGFSCSKPLEIGAVYESHLRIWTQEVLHAFLEIVRIEKAADGFTYGAIFIGMPELEASRIQLYDTINNLTQAK